MNREDIEDLAALARRLGSTPRRVLLAAARMTEEDRPDARRHLQATRQAGTQQGDLADECANLLLTSPNSHALVDLTKALRTLWNVAN